MTSFDLYQLPAEYDQLRATVRALAEEKIAPWAAEVDEQARFPAEALTALVGADLHAAHVPAAYGGQGADALDPDTGLYVMTAAAHEKRGYCCNSRCRHCPFN